MSANPEDLFPVAEDVAVDDTPPLKADAPPDNKADDKPPAEAKKEDPPAPRKKPDHVPLATFLEEKSKFQRAIEEERAARAALEERLKKFENPPAKEPDYEADPKAYIKHATKESAQEVLAKLDETTKKVEEVHKATAESREETAHQRFLQTVAQHEDVFLQTNPDYFNALAHIRKIRMAQLREYASPDVTDQQLQDYMGQEELNAALQALQRGRNPAEVSYRIAQTLGYTKPAAPAKDDKKKDDVVDLRELPKNERLPPDMTLGQSNGKAPDPGDEVIADPEDNPYAAFDNAIEAMFGKNRKR